MNLIFTETKVNSCFIIFVCLFCFWFSGPLRQYFSLYWAVPQREREKMRERIVESKNV